MAGIQGVLDGGTSVAGPTLDETTAVNGEVQQGLRGLDTDGTAVDVTAGHYYDLSGVATQVRLGAATIDASASAADVILRVSTNAASAVGAQTITTSTGDDTVIFDNLNDNDANNDQSGVSTGTFWLDTAGTAAESGVTIDARSLNAQNHFTFNGEEGATRTNDRFMFTDANINGGNTIDGGAVDNLSDTNSP